MTSPSVAVEDVAREAARVTGSNASALVDQVVELQPHGTVRTFRAGGIVVRVDEDPAGDAVAVEALVLEALATACVPSLSPHLKARGSMSVRGHLDGRASSTRPFLAYPWVVGSTLTPHSAAPRAREVGEAFGRLHAAHVMDLFGRLKRERPLTLLESFRRTVEALRGFMAARELDGLGQDELTLALSDVQRALRGFCIAQDHLFLSARRRVLCHGRPAPHIVVGPANGAPLVFVGFEGAYLGDAAEDLAGFAIAGGLDGSAEDALVQGYLDALEAHGRPDVRFIPRYFARRTLGLFARPMELLDTMVRIKRGECRVQADPVVVLEDMEPVVLEGLARAISGLRELGGRARVLSAGDIRAMGPILSYEEVFLAGRTLRIVVVGDPYAGKSEVAAHLARRLQHPLLHTHALGGALAYVERTPRPTDGSAQSHPAVDALSADVLVRELEARGFELAPRLEPPFHTVRLDGNDITDAVGTADARARGAALLEDAAVRRAVAGFVQRHAAAGVVIEGPHADELLGGRRTRFFLTAPLDVRRARLAAHHPELADTAELDRMLTAHDTSGAEAHALGAATRVHVGQRTAASVTRELLWHLLPPGRRPPFSSPGQPP